ncbi:MAG: Ig-like domain-containing protein [Vicinamibacterales bacterium]
MKRQILLVLALACIAAACDRAQLLAPTDSALTLTSAATFLAPSGTTTITAVVIESAGTQVQNGTTVRFTTTLGRLEPAEAQTRNGVATTTFHADGASGVATIRASSGAAASEEEIEILVGTAAVENIAVRVNPSSVPPSGGTVTVTARVTGEQGQGLSGIPVAFTTSAGTLSSSTATTDANGDATVQLTTTREATVTARAGGEADEVEIALLAAATVTLSTPTSTAVGVPVSLTVTPTEGTSPRVVIEWGDGRSTDLGIMSGARTVTHVYEEPGTFTISANATDNGVTNTTSTTVVITVPTGPTISVSPANGTTAATFTFTVTPNVSGGIPSDVTVEFGDGSSQSLGAISTATTVTHRYTTAGTYVARAVQTNPTGTQSATTASAVTVTAAP